MAEAPELFVDIATVLVESSGECSEILLESGCIGVFILQEVGRKDGVAEGVESADSDMDLCVALAGPALDAHKSDCCDDVIVGD